MSMQNVKGIEAAQRAAKAVADSARARQKEAQAEREKLEAQRQADADNLAIALRASVQASTDQLRTIEEELTQLDYVVNNGTSEEAPASTPVASAAPEPEEEASAPEPEPEPEPEEEASAPEPEPEPEPEEEASVISHRFVDVWQASPFWARLIIILAALLGAFVFMIAAKLSLPIIHWGTSDWWSWLAGVAAFLWQAGLIVGGFGLGGWLAARWFARHPR